MNREHITYSAGAFGDSPTPTLALVCVTCGREVCLVTADDLAGMDELPGHDCQGTVAA
jgi:hypothetical protein